MQFTFLSVWSFVFLTLVGASAQAQELKIATASVVYSSLIEKGQAEFEKESGLKLTFANDFKSITPPPELMKLVLSGKADIGLAAIDSEGWAKLMEKEPALKEEVAKTTYRVVGALVIKIFTHPGVGAKELNDKQLGGILTGTIKNWKEVGGADLPVVLVRQTNSQARDTYFKKKVMSDKDFAPEAKSLKTIGEIFEAVASTPGAIGFLQAEDVAGKPGIVLPKTPIYGRPVTAVTLGRPSEAVRKFEKFLQQQQR